MRDYDEYDENKESSYLKYWDVNNLYGWAMSQTMPVDDFTWVENTFIKALVKPYQFSKAQ